LLCGETLYTKSKTRRDVNFYLVNDYAEAGLRELKKRKTRDLIRATAFELFCKRGFERVTVAEIARAAEVSRKTVFNYFPTKEDLVYSALEDYEQEMLDAVRRRAPGESALAAFRRFLLQPRALLAGKRASPDLKARIRMIAASPALRAREQQVLARYTDALAGLLAEETGAEPGSVEPIVAASAMLAVHRALMAHVARRLDSPRLADEVRAEAERAFALLSRGLDSYAVAVA
jgi:AcrR family transcriptional regulator